MTKNFRITVILLCASAIILPIASEAGMEREKTLRQRAQMFVDQGIAINDNSNKEAEYYLKAIEIDPTYSAAYFNLGFLYHSQGNLEKAIDTYRECIRHNPQKYEAHYNLATCLLTVRRDAALYEVRHHLNLAIELQEDLPSKNHLHPLVLQKNQLIDLERKINEVLQPTVHERYTYEDIIEILDRPVIRGGQRVYEGPRLPMLFFDTGSAKLVSQDEAQLRLLAKALNSPPLADYSFIIEGHADSRGRAERNLNLANQRAEVVEKWLAQKAGVKPMRLVIKFYGEDHPIFPNNSSEHYKYNRRSEVIRMYAP